MAKYDIYGARSSSISDRDDPRSLQPTIAKEEGFRMHRFYRWNRHHRRPVHTRQHRVDVGPLLLLFAAKAVARSKVEREKSDEKVHMRMRDRLHPRSVSLGKAAHRKKWWQGPKDQENSATTKGKETVCTVEWSAVAIFCRPVPAKFAADAVWRSRGFEHCDVSERNSTAATGGDRSSARKR